MKPRADTDIATSTAAPHGSLRPRRRWARTRLTAAAAAVVIVATAASTGTSTAQTSPIEAGEIRNGTAKAIATIGRYVPGVGDLALGMTSGVSVTQVTNFLGQATSQMTDLGLIGSSLTAESCDGGAAYITPEDLPQPTFVDNRDGDAAATRDEFGTTGSPVGAGRMTVEAFEDPVEARASTTMGTIDLPGMLRFAGGESFSRTRVLPGEGREAYARVDGNLSLGGGTVSMAGMVWHAYHRTGVDPHAEAGFEMGESTVGSQSYDPAQGEAFEAAANTALAPLGISIAMPEVERLVEPNDLVRVGPMRIELRDSPAGKTVLGPVLDATRDQREQAFEELVAFACDMASVLLVGDVVVSIASGSGFFTVEFGGASASSSDFEVFDPFGSIGAPPPSSTPAAVGRPSSPTPTSGGVPATVPTTRPRPGGQVAAPIAATDLVEHCESLHPNRTPDCSEGSLLAVGVLGLLATVAVAGADLVRSRRRSGAEVLTDA